jgi:serine/threonine protein kinase
VIGRYELLLPIARGGMGTVHLARMRGMGGFERDVALKLAHDHLDPDLATQDLFAEAKIAARLRHPNVVPVLDVGEDDGRPYIVMDYVEGDSLAGLLKGAPKITGEPMPIAIGLRAITDSLSGLHAAHELVNEDGTPLTLVHRDFSPQNVLVGLDGLARLTDFGVAKLLARQDTTRSGVVKGKVRYMSPEQARGEKLDRRCDVWAAGVVLWEMLARKKLFTGDNDANVLLKIVTEPPKKLREIDPEIHPALEEVVAGALEHDLAKRTATARALRQDLVKAIRDAGLDIEQEDVAAFATKIAGDAVAERRTKAAAVARATALKTSPSKDNLPISDHTEVMIGAPVAAPPPPRPRAPDTMRIRERPPPPPPSSSHAPESETTSGAASLVSSGAVPPWKAALPQYEVVMAMLQKQPLYVALAGGCVALLFVGAILIVVSLARRHGDAPPAVATTSPAASAGVMAAASIIAESQPAPSVRAAPAPQPPPVETAHTRAVELRGNADIKEIRYLDKSIAVEPPRALVMLSIPDAELAVEAIAVDGRKASARLGQDAAAVSFAFAPKPVPAAPGDGLAPSPYKGKK